MARKPNKDKSNLKLRSDVLAFIEDYWLEHNYSPCIRDIAKHFERSTSHVQFILEQLVADDFLNITPGIARSIVPTSMVVFFDEFGYMEEKFSPQWKTEN